MKNCPVEIFQSKLIGDGDRLVRGSLLSIVRFNDAYTLSTKNCQETSVSPSIFNNPATCLTFQRVHFHLAWLPTYTAAGHRTLQQQLLMVP